MNNLVKRVRDLDAAARKKVEEGLETPLSDDQQIVIEPLEGDDELPPLPDWLHFYKGLSDREIDEIEKTFRPRAEFGRPVE